MQRKKLIEVALPLDAINRAAAREKSIRYGHPSTLHLWWARRPLAAARAVIFAQMVDDPSSRPELFPTEQAQDQERRRLFDIMTQLVTWENTTNESILTAAHDEILTSWRRTCADYADHPRATELFNPERLPAFHDPFAGGGTLPLEAQRLGLEAYASDLNPVAVLISKAMIEIPPKFAGRPPVNPKARLLPRTWTGAAGLAEDVRYYGHWLRREAQRRIGNHYPGISITEEMVQSRPDLEAYAGRALTVTAWLWVRTVKSPNPAFSDVDVPLASTFMLSTKTGSEAYVQPVIEPNPYHFTVKTGASGAAIAAKGTKLSRDGSFRCVMSGTTIAPDYIKAEGHAGRIGVRLMAIVAESERRQMFLSPTIEQETAAKESRPHWKPDALLPSNPQTFATTPYGLTTFADLFTPRQLLTLNTFSDLVIEARDRVRQDAIDTSFPDDQHTAQPVGATATDYADAVALYLGIAVSRLTDVCNSLCRWDIKRATVRRLFVRQHVPMLWDFAEKNLFVNECADYASSLINMTSILERVIVRRAGFVSQRDAQTQSLSDDKLVSTDPPYYDNVLYADLSDFFYVWLRRSLGSSYTDIFTTPSTPKKHELVTTPNRHGSIDDAERHYLQGMTRAMQRLAQSTHMAMPVTIYYALKESEKGKRDGGTARSDWETFLDALIRAGFTISGTWPMRAELRNRTRSTDPDAPSASRVLVCRKRPADSPVVTRRRFVAMLTAELPPALNDLRRAGISSADVTQAAVGAGMSVYTRYTNVLDDAGNPILARDALAVINQIIADQGRKSMTRIEDLELRNYRLFRHARWSQLSAFTVVVGANGSGKSTLFDALSFLKECLTENVAQAVARRGGFRELVSRGESGPVGITIKFRESTGRLATYLLEIDEQDGHPIVGREVLSARKHYLDFSKGRGTAITDEPPEGKGGDAEDRERLVLEDPSTLAIKGLGQFRGFRIVSEFRSLLERWHISDFQISNARQSGDAGLSEHLSTRGDDVAQAAAYLYEHHPDRFQRILDVMRRRVPGVTRVEAKATEDGRLVLRFQDGTFQDPFIARYVSDGTIKMFAYLILLHDPKPHPVLAVEEPENQLYPRLLSELVEEFRDYARRGGQVFVSTHSPEFINGAKLEEIYWLVKDRGFATVRRAADSDLLRRLLDEGDLPGALWKQGLFEGADPR